MTATTPPPPLNRIGFWRSRKNSATTPFPPPLNRVDMALRTEAGPLLRKILDLRLQSREQNFIDSEAGPHAVCFIDVASLLHTPTRRFILNISASSRLSMFLVPHPNVPMLSSSPGSTHSDVCIEIARNTQHRLTVAQTGQPLGETGASCNTIY